MLYTVLRTPFLPSGYVVVARLQITKAACHRRRSCIMFFFSFWCCSASLVLLFSLIATHFDFSASFACNLVLFGYAFGRCYFILGSTFRHLYVCLRVKRFSHSFLFYFACVSSSRRCVKSGQAWGTFVKKRVRNAASILWKICGVAMASPAEIYS